MGGAASVWSRLGAGGVGGTQEIRALAATAALFALGAVLAPGSVSAAGLLAIVPFMAILGVAAIGQHLVIQQRGLDLSVAGAISLAAVLVTALPPAGSGTAATLAYVALALVAGVVGGLVNGALVAWLRVPALVTTIGMNAVLLGITLLISGGTPRAVPAGLGRVALARSLGIPNTVWLLLLFTALATLVIDRMPAGRRFVAVGMNAAAARAIAIPVARYRLMTYATAGLCYATAGVMLAGFLDIPSLMAGNSYILATVAAVVVGGNAIGGGARASVPATVIGAVFLTYLGQLVLSLGFERSMQDIVEAVIVIAGVGLPALTQWRR